MLSKRNRAAAPTTAQKNIQHNESYSVSVSTSTTKFSELAANLLFGLQSHALTVRQRKHGWQLFEVVLRQYYDLKLCGGIL